MGQPVQNRRLASNAPQILFNGKIGASCGRTVNPLNSAIPTLKTTHGVCIERLSVERLLISTYLDQFSSNSLGPIQTGDATKEMNMKTRKCSGLLTLLLCLAAFEAMTVNGQDLDPIPVGQTSPEIEWGQVGEVRGNLAYSS